MTRRDEYPFEVYFQHLEVRRDAATRRLVSARNERTEADRVLRASEEEVEICRAAIVRAERHYCHTLSARATSMKDEVVLTESLATARDRADRAIEHERRARSERDRLDLSCSDAEQALQQLENEIEFHLEERKAWQKGLQMKRTRSEDSVALDSWTNARFSGARRATARTTTKNDRGRS